MCFYLKLRLSKAFFCNKLELGDKEKGVRGKRRQNIEGFHFKHCKRKLVMNGVPLTEKKLGKKLRGKITLFNIIFRI